MTNVTKMIAVTLGMAALSGPVQAIDSCDYGTPHPDMPVEFEQYGFLIGDYEIRARAWTGESWSEGYREARWSGRYTLGGRAVMDEWFDSNPDDNPATQGGINIRMYDAAEGQWEMTWLHSGGLKSMILRSEVRDDGLMHMWRLHPTPETRKVYFVTTDADNWARYHYERDESDENWVPKFKLEAHRIPCDQG